MIVLYVQDEETVVGDIRRGIEQFKNLSNVRLEECCNELTRGVVEGLKDPKCLSKLTIAGDCSTIYINVNGGNASG